MRVTIDTIEMVAHVEGYVTYREECQRLIRVLKQVRNIVKQEKMLAQKEDVQ